MSEADWQRILTSGHWGCGGWWRDGDSALTCACGAVLAGAERSASAPERGPLEQAILGAIRGHQTYAYTGESDTGWIGVDDFAQCKCDACVIARAGRIGSAECDRQRREAYERLAAEARERDRARFADDIDEVPF